MHNTIAIEARFSNNEPGFGNTGETGYFPAIFMKPVRLFRHINCSSPGYLGEFLDNCGVPFEITCIGEGMQVPDSLEDVSGLVFMGGPGDVNSSPAWMRQETALIRRTAEHGTAARHCRFDLFELAGTGI